MTNTERQQLLNKVLKHRVKGLSDPVRAVLGQYDDSWTLHEKSIKYLTDIGMLSWPLDPMMEAEVVMHKDDIHAMSKYLKVLISQNFTRFPALPATTNIWLYANGFRQTLPTCRMCTTTTRWSQSRQRYTLHCSDKCRANDPVVVLKRANTCQEKYGHDKLFSNESHMLQTRNICLQKRGVEFPFQQTNVRLKAIKTKIEQYGQRYQQTINKNTIKTLNKKLNTTGKNFGQLYSSTPYQDKRARTVIERWLPNRLRAFVDIATPLFKMEDYVDRFQLLPYQCVRCDTAFEDSLQDGSIPRCHRCYPLRQVHFTENEVSKFIRYDLGVEIIQNDTKVLNGKELDVLIPSVNVAVEFNGLYWHSEMGSRGRIDRNYHLNKTIDCAKRGIQLLHIFEDEWVSKKEIVKSIIARAITNTSIKIGARKCKIERLSSRDANDFLNLNHIQGQHSGSVRYGLRYKNDIVCVMTFGKSRFSTNHEWEVYRLCSKIGYTIQGGASKMLRAFEQEYNPSSIITYSDKRLFTGNVYREMGFTKTHETRPGYYYVDIDSGCGVRLNRVKFQKHKLSNLLTKFDNTLSEKDNMINNNYSRIWDVGQHVFVKEFKRS